MGCSLGQREGLSELDRRRVNSLYNCRGYQGVDLSLAQRVRRAVFTVTDGGSRRGGSEIGDILGRFCQFLRGL